MRLYGYIKKQLKELKMRKRLDKNEKKLIGNMKLKLTNSEKNGLKKENIYIATIVKNTYSNFESCQLNYLVYGYFYESNILPLLNQNSHQSYIRG